MAGEIPSGEGSVFHFLDIYALGFGLEACGALFLGKSWWWVALGVVGSIFFHLLGTKWSRIKPKIWPRLASALELISGNRLYRRSIFVLMVIAFFASIGFGLYRHYHSSLVQPFSSSSTPSATVEPPSLSSQQTAEPTSKTTKPQAKQAPEHSIPANAKPIDVLSFNSNSNLTVRNLSNSGLYIIGMQTTQELGTSYISLNFAVPPQEIKNFSLKPEVDDVGRIIHKRGETWKDHYFAATRLYGDNCVVTVYFSPNDSGLASVKEYYSTRHDTLVTGEATGVIHYRLSNSSLDREQTVRLVAVIMHNPSCAPQPIPAQPVVPSSKVVKPHTQPQAKTEFSATTNAPLSEEIAPPPEIRRKSLALDLIPTAPVSPVQLKTSDEILEEIKTVLEKDRELGELAGCPAGTSVDLRRVGEDISYYRCFKQCLASWKTVNPARLDFSGIRVSHVDDEPTLAIVVVPCLLTAAIQDYGLCVTTQYGTFTATSGCQKKKIKTDYVDHLYLTIHVENVDSVVKLWKEFAQWKPTTK